MPMDKIFTSYLTYMDISVESIDLLEDAFFSDIDYCSLLNRLPLHSYEPSIAIVEKLLQRI
jgi:hypothetical protein